jgi:hypothetical protein
MRRLAPLIWLAFAAPSVAQPVPAEPEPRPAAAPAPLPAPDPARMAVAERIMGKLMPDGTYRQLMGDSFTMMASKGTEAALDLKLRDLMKGIDMPEAQRAKLGPGSIGQIMRILDPSFTERQRLINETMFSELTQLMAEEEPAMRQAMANAYARRFTLDQLNDIDRFFSTPSGSAYAASNLTMMSDPAVQQQVQSLIPKIGAAMPSIIAKGMAATKNLPPVRKIDQLTDAERAELGRLLGITLPAAHAKKDKTT